MVTGAHLRELRLERGMQAKVVADRAGLTKQQFSAIEAGTRSIEVNEYVAIMAAMNYRAGDYLPNSMGDDVAAYLPLLEQVRKMPAAALPRIRAMLGEMAMAFAEVMVGGSIEAASRRQGGSAGDVPRWPAHLLTGQQERGDGERERRDQRISKGRLR